jgi:hypothetical protein
MASEDLERQQTRQTMTIGQLGGFLEGSRQKV